MALQHHQDGIGTQDIDEDDPTVFLGLGYSVLQSNVGL